MNVVFDLGGVVFDWHPTSLLERELPAHANSPEATQRLFESFFSGWGGEWGEFDRGTIELPALARGISARSGLTPDEVLKVVAGVPAALKPRPATLALIEELKAAGHRVFYLSNMPAPIAAFLIENHAFFEAFEDGVFSSTVKLIKPDAAIFRHALQQFGTPAADCVFLDDYAPNVATARAEGWRAIHFTDAAVARPELVAFGLL